MFRWSPWKDPNGSLLRFVVDPAFQITYAWFSIPLKSTFGTWRQHDFKKWAGEFPRSHQKLTASKKLRLIDFTTIIYNSSSMSITSENKLGACRTLLKPPENNQQRCSNKHIKQGTSDANESLLYHIVAPSLGLWGNSKPLVLRFSSFGASQSGTGSQVSPKSFPRASRTTQNHSFYMFLSEARKF